MLTTPQNQSMECLHKDIRTTTHLFSQSWQLGNWHTTLILPGIPEFRGICSYQPITYLQVKVHGEER